MALGREQQRWWWELHRIIKAEQAYDLYGLQAAARQLAMEMLNDPTLQPHADKIVLGTETLIQFPYKGFSDKQTYIDHHQQNGVWGEDPILNILLYNLGYKASIELNGIGFTPDPRTKNEEDVAFKSYEPFKQENTGLSINLVNSGVNTHDYNLDSNGTHWTLKGRGNPGGGNCMYYSVAQQIEQDIKAVLGPDAYEQPASTTTPHPTVSTNSYSKIMRLSNAATMTTASVYSSPTMYQSPIQAPRPQPQKTISAAVLAQIKQQDAQQESRYQSAKGQLGNMVTAVLIDLYNYAKTALNSDYLQGRIAEVDKERGSDMFSQALTGKYGTTNDAVLRNELVHALAREASINDEAYAHLQRLSTPTKTTNSSFFNSSQTCAAEVQQPLDTNPYQPTGMAY